VPNLPVTVSTGRNSWKKSAGTREIEQKRKRDDDLAEEA
jgi:hypothetical protein